MPDVGVLSLTIESNANKAAEGLNQLAGALERIQTAVGTELNLKGIVSPLNKLTKAVNDSKSLANIGTFLNSIASYKKAFKDLEGVQFNAEPIKQLKAAVGDGIKIGQAGTQLNNLRAALEGEWKTDNAYQAGIALSAIGEGAKSLTGTSLASHAKNLSAMATSISEYAKSIAELKAAATGGVSASSAIDSSQISATASAMGANIPAGAAIGIFSNDSEAIEAARQMALAMLDAAKKVLGIASPSTEFKKVGEYTVEGLIEGVRSRIGDAAKVLSDMTNAAILSAKDNAPLAAKEVADAIKSTIATMMEGVDLPDTVKNTIISAAKEAGDFTKSLVGSVSKENYGVAAKISSEAVFATITTATNNALDSMGKMQDDLVQVKNEVQSAGEVIEEKVSNGIETAAANTETLRNNVQDVKKELSDVKPYASIEDAFKGISFGRQRENDLMSNWLHGNGTEREQLYAFKETARMFGMTVDDVKAKVNELLEAEGSSFRFTIGEEIAKENPAIQETNASMSEHVSLLKRLMDAVGPTISNAFNAVTGGIKRLGAGMKAMFPTITGLIKRFKGMLIMRTMRYIIRQLAAGLSEGIKNVYYYSQAVESDFAPAMDSAASSLAQMKNSIGAAVAPVLQAIIPILQTIVNWFIQLINYVNQFFALLRGQKTWLKAMPTTVGAFDKQKKAAKGASNAIKDLLADWDELNIIQSQTGGGSGIGDGTKAEDYLKLFEEVGKFENKIKDIVDFIRDNFGLLKSAALDIGAAILGWKLSKAFAGWLGALGTLAATVAVVDLSLKLTDAFGKQFVNTGDPGWFIADALTGAVGATLAGKLASQLLGNEWGLITAGFTLMLEGDVNLKNSRSAFAQALTARGQMLAILGSTQMGIGAALIAAGFTASTPFAFMIGAAAATYSYVVNALAAVNITGIKWGTNTLSSEDVDTFVREQMLTTDIDAQIKITHAAIDLAEGEADNLSSQATALLVPVHSLTVGLNIDASLAQIKKDVFEDGGLISQFKKFVGAQQELVNTAEAYAPTIDKNGVNKSKEMLEASNSGWTELNNLFDQLGSDLSHHLTRAMDTSLSEDLRQFEINAVEEITDTMIRVSMAGKRAAMGSDALTELAFSLETASEGTFSDIKAAYDAYRENLTKENEELKKAEASSFASQAAMYGEYAKDALKKAHGDETDELYQYYLGKQKFFTDKYDEIMHDLASSVQASVDEATAPGKELFRESIRTMLAAAQEVKNGQYEMFANGKIKGLPIGAAGGVKEKTELGFQELIFAGKNEGITSENKDVLLQKYKEWLGYIVEDLFPADYGLIQSMLDLGYIDYTDIFDFDTLFENMEKFGYNTDFYREMLDILMGENKTKTGNETLFDKLGITSGIEEAKEKATTTVDEIKKKLEELNDSIIKITVQEELDNAPATGSYYGRGNIDLNNRAILNNNDGTFSTENSSTIEIDGKFIVIPTVIDGKQLGLEEAEEYFNKSGQHLGMFDSVGESETYAQLLHERQEELYGAKQDILGYIDDLNSGNIDQGMFDAKVEMLKYKYDEDLINSLIEELYNPDSNRGAVNPLLANARASMGVSDVNFSRSTEATEPEAGGIDYNQMANSMATAATSANQNVVSELQSILMQLSRILNKDWTVVVKPSSDWGQHNQRSGNMWNRSSGENY